MSALQLIDEVKRELSDKHQLIIHQVKCAKAAVDELNKIALKPATQSVSKYLEGLIEVEKIDNRPGGESRLHQWLEIQNLEKIQNSSSQKADIPFGSRQYYSAVKNIIPSFPF